MSDGYSRSPKLLKGAIVQFSAGMIIPIPNIIIFQYNPESLNRTLTPFDPDAAAKKAAATPTGDGSTGATGAQDQPFDPTEQFNLQLFLDATDPLEDPEKHPVAFVTGVADRIAALEMLLYPTNTGLLGSLLGSVSVSLGGVKLGAQATTKIVPNKEVPVILFVWGPGRILPVRLTAFSVDEMQHNQLLYPHRAKVTIGMRVITSESLRSDSDLSSSQGKDLAAFAYDFTMKQKQVLATLNIANTVESILGILPF